MGKVEAYMNEGYSAVQIAEKMNLAESSIRRLIYDVEKKLANKK